MATPPCFLVAGDQKLGPGHQEAGAGRLRKESFLDTTDINTRFLDIILIKVPLARAKPPALIED